MRGDSELKLSYTRRTDGQLTEVNAGQLKVSSLETKVVFSSLSRLDCTEPTINRILSFQKRLLMEYVSHSVTM